jgi:hypothetical protein
MKSALAGILFIFTSIYPYMANADTYQVETAYLKSMITTSSCVFIRNGVEYKGSEAITHINRKEEYFRKEIKTTDDFIRLAATKSEISGQHYTVICLEGNAVNLGDWLKDGLLNFRKSNQ